jgi:hypothetical protein
MTSTLFKITRFGILCATAFSYGSGDVDRYPMIIFSNYSKANVWVTITGTIGYSTGILLKMPATRHLIRSGAMGRQLERPVLDDNLISIEIKGTANRKCLFSLKYKPHEPRSETNKSLSLWYGIFDQGPQ